MQKLIQGVQRFQKEIFEGQQKLFQKLEAGQSPHTLFITCSDSRISPNLLTQTEPGEVFILRNAGNLVPSYGATHGGEAATIEYAIAVLGVRDIVVCGHSGCGAMKGLLNPGSLSELPAVRGWLSHAEATRRVVRDHYKDRSEEELLNITIQENVLAQIENLRTHPAVASALAAGKLHIHGWVYKIGTGQVFSFDPAEGQFLPLTQAKVAQAAGRRFFDATLPTP